MRARPPFSRSLISALTATVAVCLVLSSGASGAPAFTPGSDGVGDPYYPQDGNGGYDVGHYDLAIDYHPATDVLRGVATITATATQNLSRFDLDLDGLTVRSIRVQGRPATWSRAHGELKVTPAAGIRDGARFLTVVRYGGVPTPIPEFGGVGVIPTDDGAQIQGEPHVATAWFPVNDHPSDKATYTVHVTVPAGLEVVGNGRLAHRTSSGGRTTWTWDEPDPMASYLATASIGQFDVSHYTRAGIRYWDALDPDLSTSVTPTPVTGKRYVWSQPTSFDGPSYKRLSRVVRVPAGGGSLSFWVNRHTEQDFDYFFVEAHPVGTSVWTTLPDTLGHTSQDTGLSCSYWSEFHPFIRHYQTVADDGTCSPSGTTGSWWAATGASDGWEKWNVDLDAYAGQSVRLSLTVASDDEFQERGVFLDDITTPTGAGDTSFENGPDPLAGWTVTGPPPGSGPNENDWAVFRPAQVHIPTIGDYVRASFARQPEIIRFLSSKFGPYPFATAGGVVDDLRTGFALENQTRPVYDPGFWDEGQNDGVVVHEVAHQWYGDSVSVARWRDIWLNEGFASYAEWLWGEKDGEGTADQTFDFFYNDFQPNDPNFWNYKIGNPGRGNEFVDAVYVRGAMTLHVLRRTVGDHDFFTIMRKWAAQRRGGNGTVQQFIALAEHVSGQQLDDLFDTWLFTSGKPSLPSARVAAGSRASLPTAAAKQSISWMRTAGLLR